MLAPGYDDAPPSYEYDETSGDTMQDQHNNLDPSAPPDYNDVDMNHEPPPSTADEGTDTNHPLIPNRPSSHLFRSSLPQRSIYIVKMPNEPVPIITVITPDLIPQYQTQHIVYPKSQQGTSQIQVIKPIMATKALRTKINRDPITTRTAPLPLSVLSTNHNNNIDIYKPQTNVTNVNASDVRSGTIVAHHGDNNSLNVCGSSDVINRDKRTPSDIPNKYNLMYGRMNLLTIVYLWVLFIMIRLNNNQMTQIIEYCHNEYPNPEYSWRCDATATDYVGCVADPICFIVNDYYDTPSTCFDDYDDCQCCADIGIRGGEGVYIAFYVFLAINTFRLFFVSFGFGMASINKVNPGLYVTDPITNKVMLQAYMNYLCDHPASYILGVFYSDAGKAISEGIVYNIAFPLTKFLYLNIMLLYIPFFVLISLMTQSQMMMLNAVNFETGIASAPTTPPPTNVYGYVAPTMNPTTPAPTISTTPAPTYSWQTTTTTKPPNTYQVTADLLITCLVGLGLLLIGIVMLIQRWKKKNKIERMNLKDKATSEGKEIIVGPRPSYENNVCGLKNIDETKRIPSQTANKFNLMYGWINFSIWIYLWVLLVIGQVNYGWFIGDYGACIAYIVFLALNTVRIMTTLIGGIGAVDNEYNYIVNSNTGKVQLRHFMDYLCDHPAGLIVGFLYEDAGEALREALLYNITFPATTFIFSNILIFYVPMMIMCAYQASHALMNENMWLLYTIGACTCSIGIVSNAYRFKMRNDVETSNSNR